MDDRPNVKDLPEWMADPFGTKMGNVTSASVDPVLVPKESGLPEGWTLRQQEMPDGSVLNVAIESAEPESSTTKATTLIPDPHSDH